MEEHSLALSFSNSLTEEISGITGEYVELGLDALVEDGLFKDIPIVSTAVAVYRIGKSIRERHHVSKLIVFLNEINKGIADEEKRQSYRDKFTSDEETRTQELEYILILIDRYISFDKPQMLAKLYLAYLDGRIGWEEFSIYAEVIDRFLPGDREYFLTEKALYRTVATPIPDAFIRLSAFGLYEEYVTDVSVPTTLGKITIPAKQEKTYRLTGFGEKLQAILSD